MPETRDYTLEGIPSDLLNTDNIGDRGLSVRVMSTFTPIISKHLHRHTATTTTLATATTGSGTESVIGVVDASSFVGTVGAVRGDLLHIENGEEENTHPQIVSIAGNLMTLDRHVDKAHPIGTNITKAVVDMSSAIGTIADPIEYWVQPPPNEVWHITRLILTMAHGSAGDLGTFGNIAGGITNGVIVRARQSGVYGTFTNWKTNGDIENDMYDVSFPPRSGGGGSYGTTGRGSFDKLGAVVRLDGATQDRIELYIQDDITSLGFFKVKAQGHVED